MKFIAIALLSLATFAHADTYQYTGNAFSDGNSVIGSFTVPGQLAANLNYADINPASFSFSDGYTTITNTQPDMQALFEFSTDANGNITQWIIDIYFDVYTPPISNVAEIESISGEGDFGGTAFTFERNSTNGTWVDTSTVPEPSTLAMFGTGLLGLGGILRRKLA